MNKKALAILLCVSMLFLAACDLPFGLGRGGKTPNEIGDNTKNGEINYETSEVGITFDKKTIYSDVLTSGKFYILHDGVYYPLRLGDRNFDDPSETTANPKNQIYFSTENEQNIPTLFLENGDTLVYYDTENLLDLLTWRRQYDYGYTIGLRNIKTLENSRRQYISLSKDDDYESVYEDSELYALYDNKAATSAMIDKIAGQDFTEDMVIYGLLQPCPKGATYDLDVYNGTLYQHYLATANIHAFYEYELYKSIKYTCLQDYLYEIEIPEYLLDGYYTINNKGIFRLVRESFYTDVTNFNEQLLFAYDSSLGDAYTDVTKMNSRAYSDIEYLNSHYNSRNNNAYTIPEGTFGYNDPYEEITADELTEENAAAVLQEATIRLVDLWLPKDKDCVITVKSPSNETTGDISVTVGTSYYKVNLDRIAKEYTLVLKGSDQKATLKISGLYKSYDIQLVGAKEYLGQDQLIDTPAIEETSTETESPAETHEETKGGE